MLCLLVFSFKGGQHSRKGVTKEVEDMIADLLLKDKRNVLACRLSGGMKRKLRLVCSFIGTFKKSCRVMAVFKHHM